MRKTEVFNPCFTLYSDNEIENPLLDQQDQYGFFQDFIKTIYFICSLIVLKFFVKKRIPHKDLYEVPITTKSLEIQRITNRLWKGVMNENYGQVILFEYASIRIKEIIKYRKSENYIFRISAVSIGQLIYLLICKYLVYNKDLKNNSVPFKQQWRYYNISQLNAEINAFFIRKMNLSRVSNYFMWHENQVVNKSICYNKPKGLRIIGCQFYFVDRKRHKYLLPSNHDLQHSIYPKLIFNYVEDALRGDILFKKVWPERFAEVLNNVDEEEATTKKIDIGIFFTAHIRTNDEIIQKIESLAEDHLLKAFAFHPLSSLEQKRKIKYQLSKRGWLEFENSYQLLKDSRIVGGLDSSILAEGALLGKQLLLFRNRCEKEVFPYVSSRISYFPQHLSIGETLYDCIQDTHEENMDFQFGITFEEAVSSCLR